MALMRSTDFPELLDTPLRKIFYLSLKDTRTEYKDWINIVETRKAFDDDLRMAEFGQVPQHIEGDTVLFEDAIEDSLRRYESVEFALGYVITQKMREDDQHGIMVRMTEALRKSFRNLFEVESYKILNNAILATAARDQGFDRLALLSTAHTRVDGGTAQANKPSTDVVLSNTAVEAAVVQFHTWKGEKGLPAMLTPKKAIVSSNDQFIAARVFKNALLAGSADNDENWVRKGPDANGISEYLPSRYLTDTDRWFILSEKSEHDLNLFVRKNPQFETHVDFATGNFQAKGRARIVSGFGRWYGLYGSTGA